MNETKVFSIFGGSEIYKLFKEDNFLNISGKHEVANQLNNTMRELLLWLMENPIILSMMYPFQRNDKKPILELIKIIKKLYDNKIFNYSDIAIIQKNLEEIEQEEIQLLTDYDPTNKNYIQKLNFVIKLLEDYSILDKQSFDLVNKILPQIQIESIRINKLYKNLSKNYIYFIYDKISNKIKIGKSQMPKNRLAMLQIGNPNTLELLFYTKENIAKGLTEENLHNQFNFYRENGEWFKADNRLKKYIEFLKKEKEEK